MIKQKVNSFFFELTNYGNYEKVRQIVFRKLQEIGDPANLSDDDQLTYYYYSQVWELNDTISSIKAESCRIAKIRCAYEFFIDSEFINVKDFII